MKEMLKARVSAKKSIESVMKELDLMVLINSEFIVNIHWAFCDEECLYLVMDLMEGGDLRYHHSRIRKFTPDVTQFFIACLVEALEAVHKEGIIHRDIKPENLVFDRHGYLRLTDFGIAREWTPDNAAENSGTPGYMAPEVMIKTNHGIAADYFAVGVIAYECIMGKRPYLGRSRKEIRDAIIKRQVLLKEKDLPLGYPESTIDFVNSLLQRQAHKRLGMNGPAEVKNHAYFNDFDWAALKNKTIKPSFVPDIQQQNFDNTHVNLREWNDTEEININKEILRRPSQKEVFKNYYFDKNGLPSSMKNQHMPTLQKGEEDEDGILS